MKFLDSDFLKSYWPEVVSVVASIVGFFIFLNFEIPSDVVESSSSLAAQVLGTYLGLALTTFAIYHGMNLKEVYGSLGANVHLSSEEKREIESHIKEIGKIFLITISIIAFAVSFSFVIYVLCLLAKNNIDLFSVKNPKIPNALILSLLCGFLIESTLNVVETVRTVLILKE